MAETHFEAVIIGSGFGGSVTAYRLAEAGLRVCVLERGKPYPPGSFPRSPLNMKNNFWDPSQGLHGMYNIWSFRGLEAVISSGLGGGSLIYANVLIRKDEKWFVEEDLEKGGFEYWPVTRADLDPHYDRAERMLNAQRYPFQHAPYNETPKTKAIITAAESLHLQWEFPNQAITFYNAGKTPVLGEPIEESRPNLHGRTRYTCRLCGECDIGCNYGSKNTLDYNYLTEAQRLGAEIRTRCEVRTFQPLADGGYVVRYVEHLPEREGHATDTRRLAETALTCDRLILSAGTLGTTFLLLKNRDAFPHISDRLGTRFSGNGDILTFAFRSRVTRPDGTTEPCLLDPSCGPPITVAIRIPDILDGGQARGHYIEDAGYPEILNWLIELGNAPGTLTRLARFLGRRIRERFSRSPHSDLSAEIGGLLGTCELSSSSIPLLGMGRDFPDGNMRLRGGYLDIDWTTHRSRGYFEGAIGTMREIARAMQAEFVVNPTWFLNRVATVHPLGGCPMGRHEKEGVVDAYGEVFNYPGLHIADGSVMPGPVGPNPSLTIAALADRFADRIIDHRKRVSH